ncbi:MAG: tetratricopeptide repeat protein [Alphaproteobacteria bacterium]
MELNEALKLATQLYSQGRLDQAQNVISQIVKARPKHPDARNLLGVILQAKGDDAGAVEQIKKAIEIRGDIAQYHSNLGEIERQRGNADKATYALRKAIGIDPNYSQAYNNMGIIYYDKKEFDEAAKSYEKALELNEGYPEAHNNLGNAYRALDRGDEALEHYERAIMLKENYAEAYNNMATVLRDKDLKEEAEHAYKRAIQLKPDYTEAFNNLASFYIQEKNTDEALRILGEGLKVDDKNVPILVNVARVQLEKNNYEAAEMACKISLQQDPGSAEAECVYGQICHDLDQYDEALGHFEKAIQLNPDYGEANNHYGIALKSVGRLDDAKKQFERTLERNEKAFGAYSNLADLQKFTPKTKLLKKMEKLMKEAEDPDTERYMALHFALGKAYDDSGQYDKAFSHFSRGTKLKRAKLDYKEDDTKAFFEDIKATFTKDIFGKDRPFEGLESEKPVFVLGMPRSGSTLTEQIISSHPQAFGAGEIKTLARSIGSLRSKFPNVPRYPAMVGKMNVNHYKLIGELYLEYINSVGGDSARVTDKMLSNYYFVGLLNLIFPKAKVINIVRNPVDTCLSAYTKLFKDDMPHSYDLGEMGRYYMMYEDIIAHWHKVLPKGYMMQVNYEDVVNDTEGKAKELIDFVGLPWDKACVSFHKSKRPIKTASVVQVRKPVYKTSVERWKNYGAKNLQPLLDALEWPRKAPAKK